MKKYDFKKWRHFENISLNKEVPMNVIYFENNPSKFLLDVSRITTQYIDKKVKEIR